MSINDAMVRFSFAAQAAGLPEKTLRNWLDRGLVTLRGETDRGGRGWRRFALSDVLRIALVGRLVAYGVRVSQADDIVGMAIDHSLEIARRDGRNKPNDLGAALYRQVLMIRHSEDGGLDVNIGGPADSIADLPADCLLIRLDALADGVVRRLEEGL